MILSLQSTTFGAYGGIPTYNRVICRALNDLPGPIERQVFLVTDTPADLEIHRGEFPQLSFTAFSGKRSAFVRQVVRVALSGKIDLLLIGHANYAPIGMLLKFLLPALRYGVMVHGVDVWSRLPLLRRQALRRANFVSSVSDYTTRQVISLNQVDRRRIYLLPNALEWKEANGQATPASQAPTTATRLLTVCRLNRDERYKGVDTVIAALPSVIRSVPDVQYFVIGSGTDLERHKRLAERHSVSNRVHFLGSVDLDTLQAHYAACDVFVMPSAGEGFGIVFLEAMRYSKPVVAANSGAVSEVVEDQVTGLLVKYGNEGEVAQALTELCLDREKRTRLGSAGYQRLLERFTCAQFKRKFTEILSKELPRKILFLDQFPAGESPARVR